MSRSKKPPAPPKTRWEKSADRENERRRKKAPLFVHAGVVPLATPEERQQRYERGLETRLAGLREQEKQQAEKGAKAAAVREEIARLVSPEELAEMDRVRGSYPSNHDYSVGFWAEKLAALRGETKKPAVVIEKRTLRKKLAAEAARQLPLFEPPPPTPEEILAAPDPIPEPRPPCRECGFLFDSGKPHPVTCAALIGLFAGLAHGCEACRSRRDSPNGACNEHLAAAKLCETEGHVPHVPTKGYRAGWTVCSRCDVTVPAVSEAA
jgi:hypothetical protein